MSENNKIYSYNEAFLASVEYFEGDELAAKVFVDKYALKDREGGILENTPEKMHHRLAKEFARIEKKYPNPINEEEIFNLIDHFKYIIPQGSPMNAIGNPYHIQSSGNCFSIKPPYDSYGGIFYTDQQLGQLMKRRCVHENSTVFVLGKGNIFIKDIEVGDSVLSYNIGKKKDEFRVVKDKFYSNVDINDRVVIYLSNGTIIRTSKKHPILSIGEKGYIYKKAKHLKEKDILIKPQFKKYLNNITKQMGEKAWFIGCHMGDGTLGVYNRKDEKDYGEYSYKKLRIRNTGDNENVIREYSKIANNITSSTASYRKSTCKKYKTQCWEYSNSCNNVKILSKKYLDDQIGKKTYCGKIPSYIKKYSLWIPFLAGLIDSDGYIRPYGSIDISICAKNVIDDLGCFLSSIGISYKITKRESCYSKNSVCSKNSVFHPIYKLMIHVNYDFNQLLIKWIKHENKIKVLKNTNYKLFSHKKFLLEEERNFILDKYNLIKYKNDKKNIKDRNNLSSIIRLLKKDKNVGIGSLKSFLNNNIISKHKFDEINQRVHIKEIKKDKEEGRYIDIEVDGNNNFYAGNFGMINIHNCGVGLNLSNLRPKGELVKNAAKTTDGIAVFMERYSNTCREVAQNGRRGALILLLSIRHPEIKTFITIKQDKSKVTGANVSIQITDEFMNAVKKGDEFELKWPVDSETPLISQKVSAKEIWDLFIDSSWNSAEPGLLFWDTIINNSVSNCYGEVDESFYDTACNPCGEIVMGTDSCRLLALNLYSFVENKFTSKSYFDFDKFNIYVQKAQRLMDDMVDLEIELIKKILIKIKSDPEPENIKKIEKETWELLLDVCKKGRRTGLGITGLADALASLNIRYGSNKSIVKTEEIYKALAINAYRSTCVLAKERGPFPIFSSQIEKDNNFINKVIGEDKKLEKMYKKYGRRNIALTTTPPAGSIALEAQVSSGIESVFSIKSVRRKKIHEGDKNVRVDFVDHMGDKWQEFEVYHKGFKDWQKITGKIKVEDSPYYKATSRDIDWIASVDMQAVAQKWICHSISKTCNLPKEASKELVEKVFLRAWEKGCKGFTIYRDGCRTGVLIDKTKQEENKESFIYKNKVLKRPGELVGDLHHVSVKGIKYFVMVGVINGQEPYEIFAGHKDIENLPKRIIIKKRKRNTYCILDINTKEVLLENISQHINEEEEALTRMISLGLRHGADINFVTHQLEKTSGDMLGFSKAISRVLKKYIENGTMVQGESCPDCGGELRRTEGCVACSCGYSRCG